MFYVCSFLWRLCVSENNSTRANCNKAVILALNEVAEIPKRITRAHLLNFSRYRDWKQYSAVEHLKATFWPILHKQERKFMTKTRFIKLQVNYSLT